MREHVDTISEPKASQTLPLGLQISLILWRRRGKVFAIGLCSAVLLTAVIFLLPSYYKSTVQIMPPGWQSSSNLPISLSALAGMSAGASSLGGTLSGASLLGGRSQGATLVGILESRTVSDDLIRRFNLLGVYHVKTMTKARTILGKRSTIAEDRATGIISIAIEDRDAERARNIAQGYVDELNKLSVTMDTSAAHKERVFLENRIGELQAAMETSEKDLSSFSSQTGTLDAGLQSKAILEASNLLQVEITSTISSLNAMELEYTDNSPEVQQVKARLATLQNQLAKLQGVPDSAKGHDNTSSLSSPSLRQLPGLAVTYADYLRKTKVLEAGFELVTKELEIAKIEEAKELPSVKILDPAVTAEKPSSPNRLVLILVGALCSLLIAMFWVLATEVWRRLDDDAPLRVFSRELRVSSRRREGPSAA
jgi:uncharacterized protein involved in exopolysaccharide biosynthesis